MQSILAEFYQALQAPMILVKTTWANTRGLSEFHFRLNTPHHSAASNVVSRRPTFPGGVEYQLVYCAPSHLQ